MKIFFYGKIDDAIKEFSNKKGEFVLIFYPENQNIQIFNGEIR